LKAGKQEAQWYGEKVKKHAPRKPLLRNAILAFLVGGAICTVGQGVLTGFTSAGLSLKEAVPLASAAMIALGAFLTGVGVYDSIGRIGGMGALLPITGFANSIVSPAMEYKREGFVLGMGAKMFTVAGPVIVFGLVSAVLVGLIAAAIGRI